MRNRYLDLLRALAVVRVVVYHVTGLATLTLIFPAMSVMFALAGSLMAASLDRSGAPAVLRRLRRLLPSLWVVAAVFVPAMLLTGLVFTPRVLLWLFPVADPPANYWGALALSPIWYLRDYLWFVLASPVALWLYRRAPLPTLLAPYALLVAIESGVLVTASPVLHHFGLYFGAWLLGFAHHDGTLRRLANRVLVPTAVALGVAGGAWILTHPSPRGHDINDIPLGNALWSAAFILLVIGRAPAAAGWVDRSPLVSRLVTLVNRRALTIYLWHMPFVVLLTPMVGLAGWTDRDPMGLAVRVVLVFALVGVVTLLVGWVEDMAARRRPQLLPGGRPPARTVTAPSAATGGSDAAGSPEMPTSPPPAGAGLGADGPMVPVGAAGPAVAPGPRRADAAPDSTSVDLSAGRG
ncbi:acyltransferase [Micromonospora sp. KC606]|uniref:acyltransferase family protein n=1 Tax=Micromonospora sp. KC606 TaxID=2530379 RepID=UPI001044DF07|nr:acyltransferase [Micromonospora sp. KC606]TDC70686.1 acyltransferase [Micromonospora sp. KC606]